MESKVIDHLKFKLPFEPYPNQLLFMQDAYNCIDKSCFGLFESPTGSGKTISILCSVLTWLRDHRVDNLMQRLNLNGSDDKTIPKWLRENVRKQNEAMVKEMINNDEKELEELRNKISHNFDLSNGAIKLRFKRKLDKVHENEECNKVIPYKDRMQILVCSRTFSQLNQYVAELRKLGDLSKNIKVGIAASRYHLCINDVVKKKCTSTEEFNDHCRRSKCDYRKDVKDLIDSTTCFTMDIEELMDIGRGYCSCPYYSNLKVVPNADIILAPYVTVINESLRNNLGIKVDGNILIFDEGHNINDAITESQSCRITFEGLKHLYKSCKSFLNKFKVYHVAEVYSLIKLLEALINSSTKCSITRDVVCSGSKDIGDCNISEDSLQKLKTSSISSFIVEHGLEDIKFYEISSYLSSSDFCRCLKAWSEREYHAMKKNDPNLISYTSTIYTLRDFVSIILSSTADDYIIVTPDSFELYCVSTDELFHSLAKKAKSVIIMSGTLSPIEEFKCLVPKDMELIIHFSPPIFTFDRFLAKIIDFDKNGIEIKFDYKNRNNERELDYLCKLLESLSHIVPNGIICFFSSYKFLQTFMNHFNKSPTRIKIMTKKRLFFEGGDFSFDLYSKSALENNGAILFAVFGGTQSEGVNFTDGLARLVLLVGLPYPPDSLKLKLKRTYYNNKLQKLEDEEHRNVLKVLETRQRTLLCYKMINQCIGRAMRHRNDYAAVILLDSRYRNRDCDYYLSDYIRRSIGIYESKKVDIMKLLEDFYKNLNI